MTPTRASFASVRPSKRPARSAAAAGGRLPRATAVVHPVQARLTSSGGGYDGELVNYGLAQQSLPGMRGPDDPDARGSSAGVPGCPSGTRSALEEVIGLCGSPGLGLRAVAPH